LFALSWAWSATVHVETAWPAWQPADDRGVWGKVDVPCVGGPVDGRSLLVDVDEAGVPPETIDENWLWVEFGGELLDVDVDGAYELEPVAGAGPPWIYRGASAGENVAPPGAEPGRPRA
jgi:hypothetical protein